MVSGGADSACAAAGLARVLGAEAVHASHVNYGLRPGAADGEAAARRLCAALRIDLHVERPQRLPAGNLQAAARTIRYDAARRLRDRTGAAVIVTGHTRTDVAETTLYRLAASPGSRALLGLAPRSGRVVRPLLGLGRERIRELAIAAGLPFADDETNDEPLYARNRIRAEVLPVLRDVNSGAEPNIAETRAELAEEAAAARAGRARGARGRRRRRRRGRDLRRGARRLGAGPAAARPAGARRARRRAPGAARARARGRDRAARRAAPRAARSSSAAAWSPICESGFVRFRAAADDAAPVPEAVALGAPRAGPGRRLGGPRRASPRPGRAGGPRRSPRSTPRALAGALEVRTWREGDRIRPLGMQGTKTLQDLFTDRGVPRSLRHSIPVRDRRRRGRLGRRRRRLRGLPARAGHRSRRGAHRSPTRRATRATSCARSARNQMVRGGAADN